MHVYGNLDGLVLLQVDESVDLDYNSFLFHDKNASNVFRSRSRRPITSTPTSFKGFSISLIKSAIKTEQTSKISRLKTPKLSKEFASQRELAQYVGVNVRPAICTPVQLIAPSTHHHKRGTKGPIESDQVHKEDKGKGLDFVALNMDTARMALLTDSSFANAEGLKSQLVYINLLSDATG